MTTLLTFFFTATDTPYPSKDYQNVMEKFIIKPISLDEMLNQVKMTINNNKKTNRKKKQHVHV